MLSFTPCLFSRVAFLWVLVLGFHISHLEPEHPEFSRRGGGPCRDLHRGLALLPQRPGGSMRAGEPDFLTKKVGGSAGLCEPFGSSFSGLCAKGWQPQRTKGRLAALRRFSGPFEGLMGESESPSLEPGPKSPAVSGGPRLISFAGSQAGASSCKA